MPAPPARDAMRRPPRAPQEPIFGLRHVLFGLLDGAVLLAAVYGLYLASLHWALPAPEARAMAYAGLVFGNLVMAFATAAEPGVSFFDSRRRAFWLIAATATSLLAAILLVPSFAALFRFERPPAVWIAITLAVAIAGGGWSAIARFIRASSAAPAASGDGGPPR